MAHTSFKHADIQVVVGGKVVGELQSISYSVKRETNPIYSLGSNEPIGQRLSSKPRVLAQITETDKVPEGRFDIVISHKDGQVKIKNAYVTSSGEVIMNHEGQESHVVRADGIEVTQKWTPENNEQALVFLKEGDF